MGVILKSVFHLLCCRYLAIVHVLKRPFSLNAVKRVIVLVWLLSGIVYMGDLYKFEIIQVGQSTLCIPQWSKDPKKNALYTKYEMIVKFFMAFAIPMSAMVVLYTLMVWFLWHRKAPGEFSNENQRRIKKQMKKVIKMLITIVLVFNFCWIPVHSNHLMIAFNSEAYDSFPVSLLFVFFWLAHANSAINPCLYFIFNESFREGLKCVLRQLYGGNTRVRYNRSSTMRSTILPSTQIPNYAATPPIERRHKDDKTSSEKLLPSNTKEIMEDENVSLGIRKTSLDEKRSPRFLLKPKIEKRISSCSEALISDTQV